MKKVILVLGMLAITLGINAQKDVTQFLDIPVDGYKPEMIKKLKSKGFTIIQYEDDAVEGEFNGKDVSIFLGTNNNKVWRIVVGDENHTDEINIKIRFNNLIRQFQNNGRYVEQEDSTIEEYIIPENEDISYEILVNEKRYEAVFYQKSLKIDSIKNERELLSAKDSLTDKEHDRMDELIMDEYNARIHQLNKQVWFMIIEDSGKYRIFMYYENVINKADGGTL